MKFPVFLTYLFILISITVHGSADTVFVKASSTSNLLVDGKMKMKIEKTIIQFSLPSTGEIMIQSGKNEHIIDRAKLYPSKSYISIDSAQRVTILKVLPTPEIENIQNIPFILRREISDFNRALVNKTMEGYLDFLGKYSKGLLEKDILSLLNASLSTSLSEQLDVLMKQQSYSLATDVALSLITLKNKVRINEVYFKELASYQLNLARIASANSRVQSAIHMANKSNALFNELKTKQFLDSLQLAFIKDNFLRDNKLADSLLKSGNKIGALTYLRSALSFDQTNASLRTKIDSLDGFIQDSLYQHAKKMDVRSELIYYRQKNYTDYLSQYPFGIHADESKARITKLEKVARQLNRYYIMMGQGFLAKEGIQPSTSLKFGKFNERSIYYIGGRINTEGLLMRDSPYKKDFSNYILPNARDYRIANPDITGKNQYFSHGAVFIGYSQMVGKPGLFQFFITGSIGYGWAKQWILTYKNEGQILNFIPEEVPKFRAYEEKTSTYPLGLGFLFNYKTICFEVGADVYHPGYVGYSYSVGISF